MKINSVRRTEKLLQVFADVEGKSFEFTSFRCGPVEVYDFPKSWRGLQRFCGYMPEKQSNMLKTLAAEFRGVA